MAEDFSSRDNFECFRVLIDRGDVTFMRGDDVVCGGLIDLSIFFTMIHFRSEGFFAFSEYASFIRLFFERIIILLFIKKRLLHKSIINQFDLYGKSLRKFVQKD